MPRPDDICCACGRRGHTSASCTLPKPERERGEVVVTVRKIPGGVRYSTRLIKK